MKRPIIIAVAGGSASGKTTVVNEIKEALEGEANCRWDIANVNSSVSFR